MPLVVLLLKMANGDDGDEEEEDGDDGVDHDGVVVEDA